MQICQPCLCCCLFHLIWIGSSDQVSKNLYWCSNFGICSVIANWTSLLTLVLLIKVSNAIVKLKENWCKKCHSKVSGKLWCGFLFWWKMVVLLAEGWKLHGYMKCTPCTRCKTSVIYTFFRKLDNSAICRGAIVFYLIVHLKNSLKFLCWEICWL